MTLINVAPEEVTLVKIESDLFENIEMHEMAMTDGLMAMRQITDLVIPANGQARFEPGGWHLMLKEPSHLLTSGEIVDMTLIFKSGSKQKISINVAAR